MAYRYLIFWCQRRRVSGILTAKFPDRDPDGMQKTVMIQASKNAKRKDTTGKRGLIYYGNK